MAATDQAAAAAIDYQMLNQNGDAFSVDPDIAEIIHEGFRRIIDHEEMNDFIHAANKEIVRNCGTGIDIIGDLGDIRVLSHKGAYINNTERLKAVLEENFATLVTDDDIATQDLIDIACSADDPRAPEIRGCITIKKIVNVQWRART